ncbi:transcriptional regulator with XRE-family HTH domain [Bradyrhizobium elkanii]|uniref:helix-turn-helix domain-containing protein n=2 Tax=Nitrobacteraceae TaxID=41294 RepID=UPI0004B3EDE2|nr:helix-turn-helix transcriptional regulator [Bradyrhizobium elkanii]MCP1975474.1 transcriptional regulator with XRE-family HTH domain [Bradyrhizobium elkanii]MCS3525077.1 transcriptional regulator with XRE-family HTH domain [Bradyrhizobium elkanii]MCS4085040.1 transcriptional regulator with XRE-family HTH domain [Bradyrhizobium elkanii]MCW2175764.1 transcriptional regulator with XRE-family HTH domain [Bradyrhizobium elkanii]MDH6695417.1 transcriptional regulator with XRE-family HTH domain [B
MASRGRILEKSVHSEPQISFRELMTNARKNAGLTQSQLAKRLSKPQSFVAKYEGGERRIDVIEFIMICRTMSVDPLAILRKLAKSM